MGWKSVGKTAWEVAKKAADFFFIAVSAYQVGESHNDAEKISNAVIKINEHGIANQVNKINDEDNVFKYIMCGLLLIFAVITFVLLSKFLSFRAVQSDRRIRLSQLNKNAETTTGAVA